MPLKPSHCAQCGEALATRHVEGRVRFVCPSCQTVSYENPLPVAAAIVLNERREVLLVKRARQPQQGMWCLPMGFAELGETIAGAALRELREEAGIDGRALRLIDADSFPSDHYGDLLIVTFEIEKTGGREQAGDDAAALRYFPMTDHPPLAFGSNDKALEACAAAHMESWQIQDSFVTLQKSEDRALLSDVLLDAIQEQAAEVARVWLADVHSNPTTPSYHPLDVNELTDRGECAIAQFGRWFKGDEVAGEMEAFYHRIACERRAQGVELHELISALALLKKHLWNFVRAQGVWERPIDAYRVLEFNRLMAMFFDKATYHAARAFQASDPR